MARWWNERLAKHTRWRSTVLTGTLLLMLGACATRTTQSPGTGRITVGVTTTGSGAASRSFEVSIEPAGASGRVNADAGVFSVPDVPAGEHVVRLRDVPPACTVDGGDERTIRVVSGRSSTVRYTVVCR
jgi:hypothetical protein